MSAEVNRRARRAAAKAAPEKVAGAAVDVVVDQAADRAAAERLDNAPGAPAPTLEDSTVIEADPSAPVLAGAGVDVLPTPELIARPGEPLPIVTASPILAVEVGAVEVEHAALAPAPRTDAAARASYDRADAELAHPAAAGQPTLTIEQRVDHRPVDPLAALARPDITHIGAKPERIERATLGVRHVAPADGLLSGEQEIGGPHHITVQRHASEAAIDAAFAPRVVVIEVVGPPAGRRRAGLTFGATPLRINGHELTREQFAAIEADPLLAVGVRKVD